MSMQVMLDLETMSTRFNAVICSIGAVKFTFDGEIHDKFYQTIDAKDCKRLGLHFSQDTLQWWSEQNPAALKMLTKDTIPLGDALEKFNDWFGKDLPVWGCGANFDNVIIHSAYEAAGVRKPWKFWHDRCYRTMKELIRIPEDPREGTYHNALDDALHQVKHLCKILAS